MSTVEYSHKQSLDFYNAIHNTYEPKYIKSED